MRVPFLRCGGYGQMNGLSVLLGHLQRAREKPLFFETEELLGRQFVFARHRRAARNAKVKNHDIFLVGIHAVEERREVAERV